MNGHGRLAHSAGPLDAAARPGPTARSPRAASAISSKDRNRRSKSNTSETTITSSASVRSTIAWSPRLTVSILPTVLQASIADAWTFSCGIQADRSLWCWGSNTSFQADEGSPLGVPVAESIEPTRVPGADWLSVAAHTFHTCAVARDANVWCWGRNAEGQLDSEDTSLRVGPVEIGRRATSVDVGVFTTCLVDSAGVVACTGKNENGELGTGDRERRYTLTDVPLRAPQ